MVEGHVQPLHQQFLLSYEFCFIGDLRDTRAIIHLRDNFARHQGT